MQVEKALSEDSDGGNAAGQNRPHEQTDLLDEVNHGGNLLRPFFRLRQAAYCYRPTALRGLGDAAGGGEEIPETNFTATSNTEYTNRFPTVFVIETTLFNHGASFY